MKFSHLKFEGVKGVGSIEVDITPDKSVYAFIGENGVGKTKFLETLFQILIMQNKIVINTDNYNNKTPENIKRLEKFLYIAEDPSVVGLKEYVYSDAFFDGTNDLKFHNNPIVYIGAQNRGFIQDTEKQETSVIGNFKQRRKKYIQSQILGMEEDFASLNMNFDIEQWFTLIAQSSNPFQKQKDNRQIEILTVLELCHQIDQAIDPEFMEIGGDNRVFIKINGEETQLSHLSTGYASILKIIQSIVSGYGYFTNEQQLQHVRGIVLIDEIESHLHLSWQSKIIPTLKKLFPHTTFYITTHSPVVLVQLEEGEAYRLQREDDDVVRSEIIHHPSNISFIDLQKRAFDLDLNKIKREQMSSESQKEANQALLDFINEEAS